MVEEEMIRAADELGLSVEKIKGGYSIDKKGTQHSIQSGMLTDYGLSSDDGWLVTWLKDTAKTCGA